MPISDSAADPIDADIGARLRQLRQARGLSARQVARQAGVSPAYLSRLENGKVSPTVSTLTRVVLAMGETVAAVFGDATAGPVVRRPERRVVRNRGADDYLLTPNRNGRLEVLETVVEPGEGSGTTAYAHPGDEECIVVLAGEFRLWIDGTRYDLSEGDAATFPCRTPHRWQNPSDSPARLHWIITPAGGY
ncbi:MAG: cupin domain-containing protein [Streptosporangiales bacterium]|nr:cupin domain-containing protein [Streptosporangiales bacterium]